MKMVIDRVERTVVLFDEDGLGFTDINHNLNLDVAFNGDGSPASFFKGTPSRFKFWQGTMLTIAQAQEEYDNEVARSNGGRRASIF